MSDSAKHPVVWFEILGKDGPGLRRFYGDLFGWKIDADNPMKYGLVNTGGKQGIPGGIGDLLPGTRPWVTFYVATDDLAASLAGVESLGGRTIVPPKDLPDGAAFAIFQDPEGHAVGLLREKPRA